MDCSIVKGKRSLQRPPRSGRLHKRSRRAGPALPSYLALHHAGFSVPPMLPSKRWALTPPFHPCQTERAFRRRLAGFPARCHRASPSRRYILCGTFRSAVVAPGFSPASPTSPPGVTRRVALYPEPAKQAKGLPRSPKAPDFFVTGSREPTTTVSGLSSRHARVALGFSPALHGAASDHPAHPPVLLYPNVSFRPRVAPLFPEIDRAHPRLSLAAKIETTRNPTLPSKL